ncbi:nodulation protein NfeD, partial [Methylophaga sp. OBS4]|nr:nodulation protein NfeD [Methylophaga sp. OBS4]
MKRMLFLILSLMLGWLSPVYGGAAQSDQAFIIEINGIISPASADYFSRSLEKAVEADAAFLLIRMDTPGGLDLSMRDMIKKIITSPIPVVTYVTPGGARAASAGTYLLYASHIAAMTPATNLGAATPVQLKPGFSPEDDESSPDESEKADKSDEGKKEPVPTAGDAMTRKAVNDAVAYIRGLAELRGRNQEWAEKAVREAASLTAEEALKQNVIDIVALHQRDLIQQMNGRTVSVLGNDVTLDTTS